MGVAPAVIAWWKTASGVIDDEQGAAGRAAGRLGVDALAG
jgi:hypothetical protein